MRMPFGRAVDRVDTVIAELEALLVPLSQRAEQQRERQSAPERRTGRDRRRQERTDRRPDRRQGEERHG